MVRTVEDIKQLRIGQMRDIKEALIEIHGDEAGFKPDLDEIVAAIDKRIETIIAR